MQRNMALVRLKKNLWYDSDQRKEQCEDHVSQAGVARFGFATYREAEKVNRGWLQ